MDSGSWAWVVRQLGLHDLLLDQHVEGMEIRRPIVLRVTLRLCRIVLEGCDLGLKLFVEPPQCLLPTDDILAIESRLLSIAI